MVRQTNIQMDWNQRCEINGAQVPLRHVMCYETAK